MRTALIFCYRLKKTTSEFHRKLVEAYDNNALSKTISWDWFRRLKAGDFNVDDKKKPKRHPKKFEDIQLQKLFNENAVQTQKQLAEQLIVSGLKAMGTIQKKGKWVSH